MGMTAFMEAAFIAMKGALFQLSLFRPLEAAL
jgi:hypothetical protein